MHDTQPHWMADDPYAPDTWDDRAGHWPDDDRHRRFEPVRDRLVHLVHVDGRLVDCWTEPVGESRYARYAERFDAERAPVILPPPAPRTPPYAVALAWLDAVVGGRVALDALHEERHGAPSVPPTEGLPLGERHRLEAVIARLERAEEIFDGEVRDLLLTLLGELWEVDPQLVLGPTDADAVAAGMLWVVGRANDLFNAAAGMTQTRAKRLLDLRIAPSTYGPVLARELRGLDDPRLERPRSQPDLLVTGRPELLTARTRRRLIRLRDQALVARASAGPSAQEASKPVLP